MAESHKNLKFRDYLAIRYALARSLGVDRATITTEQVNEVLGPFYEDHPEYAKKGVDV